MAQLVKATLPEPSPALYISPETASAVGLTDAVTQYEVCRDSIEGLEVEKKKAAEVLRQYIGGLGAEGGSAFDIGGTETESLDGRTVARIRLVQNLARETLDREVLGRRLLELGVGMGVVEKALQAATKKGKEPEPFVRVDRIKVLMKMRLSSCEDSPTGQH